MWMMGIFAIRPITAGFQFLGKYGGESVPRSQLVVREKKSDKLIEVEGKTIDGEDPRIGGPWPMANTNNAEGSPNTEAGEVGYMRQIRFRAIQDIRTNEQILWEYYNIFDADVKLADFTNPLSCELRIEDLWGNEIAQPQELELEMEVGAQELRELQEVATRADRSQEAVDQIAAMTAQHRQELRKAKDAATKHAICMQDAFDRGEDDTGSHSLAGFKQQHDDAMQAAAEIRVQMIQIRKLITNTEEIKANRGGAHDTPANYERENDNTSGQPTPPTLEMPKRMAYANNDQQLTYEERRADQTFCSPVANPWFNSPEQSREGEGEGRQPTATHRPRQRSRSRSRSPGLQPQKLLSSRSSSGSRSPELSSGSEEDEKQGEPARPRRSNLERSRYPSPEVTPPTTQSPGEHNGAQPSSQGTCTQFDEPEAWSSSDEERGDSPRGYKPYWIEEPDGEYVGEPDGEYDKRLRPSDVVRTNAKPRDDQPTHGGPDVGLRREPGSKWENPEETKCECSCHSPGPWAQEIVLALPEASLLAKSKRDSIMDQAARRADQICADCCKASQLKEKYASIDRPTRRTVMLGYNQQLVNIDRVQIRVPDVDGRGPGLEAKEQQRWVVGYTYGGRLMNADHNKKIQLDSLPAKVFKTQAAAVRACLTELSGKTPSYSDAAPKHGRKGWAYYTSKRRLRQGRTNWNKQTDQAAYMNRIPRYAVVQLQGLARPGNEWLRRKMSKILRKKSKRR